MIRSLEGISVLSGGGKTVRLDGSASVLSAFGTSTVGEGQTPAFSKDGTFTITGSGSGHNLGMSQYGAKAMADYRAVLETERMKQQTTTDEAVLLAARETYRKKKSI